MGIIITLWMEVAVCLTRVTRRAGRCNRVPTVLLAVMVSLPRDSVHFRGGTIQLFVSEENEYSKGRRVLYSCVRINYWDQRKKVP